MNSKQARPRRGRPPTGHALTAAERMRRLRARRKAAGLRAVLRWVAPHDAAPYYSSHRLAEARSLAMHAAIARKISREPALLKIPHRNLDRWQARWDHAPPRWYYEWRDLLALPWPKIAARITEPSEEGARLRQSTPFAGVLDETERGRIYDAFRT